MAGKIFVTGDCHGDFGRFEQERFPAQRDMDREDFVIVCGDFGGVWSPGEESDDERERLDELDGKNYTTLFVDGNHENFDRLYEYPEEEWRGGRIHRIRENVLHLCRGYVFELAGNRIFCMGGASSRDRRGVILDAQAPGFEEQLIKARAQNLTVRIRHLSWWEEELPNAEEYARAGRNLSETEKYTDNDGYDIDYIITHCCATSAICDFGMKGRFGTDELTDFLDDLREKCTYKRWYFGHYHMDRDISKRETMLCDVIIPLGCTAEDADKFSWNTSYKRSDKVEFWARPQGERTKLIGHIYTVNLRNSETNTGGIERIPAVNYDIFAEYKGEVVLIKNVPERNIVGRA